MIQRFLYFLRFTSVLLMGLLAGASRGYDLKSFGPCFCFLSAGFITGMMLSWSLCVVPPPQDDPR